MSRGRNLSDSEDERMEYAPSSPKRTKLSNHANGSSSKTNGESSRSTRENTDSDDEEAHTLLVGDDGFVEGSIVKITLTNFVTYDYCEIFPGPQMNMIIGPNGTGKSTIVCAIALGLGGSPALLGRAKNIAEFVKTGEDEATITIELKKVNVRNIIIQRAFKKINNSTTWRINGKASSQKDVMAIIHELNIQVDNLCQFLPQDRVSEFAELSPPQLLERTQAAAGEVELHKMQQDLVEWRNKEKTLEKAQESDTDHLKVLNDKNAELEKDVMRMRQRKEILDRIALLQARIPLIKYSDAKKKTDELKEILNTTKETVRIVRAELAPIENTIKECDDNSRQIAKKQNDEALRFKEHLQHIKAISTEIQQTKESITINKSQIENIKRKIPERERDIETCKMRIRKYEEEVKEPPSEDVSVMEEGIAGVNRLDNERHGESITINQKVREESRNRAECEETIKQKKRELQEMNNTVNVRINKIRNKYPDVATALSWLRENSDKFVGKIHGPIGVIINVKDTRYASMVEQVLGGAKSSHFRYFVCENEEDYRTFTRLLIDGKKLRLNAVWPGDLTGEQFRNPTSTAELQTKYKMDHYVTDLLEGDPYVIRYLCKEAKIHLIPVALQRAREEELVNSGAFQKFCIGKTYYNVKSSEYGRRSKQTVTTPIRNAEMIGDSVDKDGRARLQEELRTLQSNLQDADKVINELGAQLDRNKQRTQELKHQKEEFQSQKKDVQRAAQNYRIRVHKLEQTKLELEELKKKPEVYLQEIKRLEKEVEANKAAQQDQLKNYTSNLRKYVESYEKRNIWKLQHIHAHEKLNAIRTYSKDQTAKLGEAEQQNTLAKKEYTLALRQTQICMKDCQDAGKSLAPELKPQFDDILRKWKEEGSEETTQTLADQIVEQEGRVAGIRFSNPNAVAHYEERKLEVANLQKKIEERTNEIEDCKRNIVAIRSEWEPRVDNLVARISEKFSAAFRRIKCAGEVNVDKQDDFDKWGINIQVKFRDNEKLQLLTGQRQSGGERSVTTVLYLMSLQELAKSPFRVVDEINQGMDPRNERMIHEQIVQGASKPGTSQYFLITPKLLPDLYYNERMRVLCIYNSEWLPSKIKPLSHYLEHAHATGIAEVQ